MSFSTMESAGFALQLSMHKFLNYSAQLLQIYKIKIEKIPKIAKKICKKHQFESKESALSYRAKPVDPKDDNIALPTKLIYIYTFKWCFA